MRWKINRYRRPVVSEITFSPEVGYTFEASGDGLSFTVTKPGGGFGAKPQGQACFFFTDLGHTAGNAALASYARDTAWAGQQGWDNIESSTAQIAPGSSRALRINLAVNPTGKTNSGGALEPVEVGTLTDRWYLWTKRYWAFDGYEMVAGGAVPGWNHKYMRVWPSSMIDTSHYAFSATYANGEAQANHGFQTVGKQQLAGIGWDSTRANYYHGPPATAFHRSWFVTEWWQRHSSTPGTADGVVQLAINGVGKFLPTASTQFISRTVADPDVQSRLFLDERSNGVPYTPAEAWAYYDSWYVEDSWCRVLLSDEPTYQTATYEEGGVVWQREIQPVLSWTDTQVGCQLRQGSHATLTGQYLYVIKNDGSALRIGQFH